MPLRGRKKNERRKKRLVIQGDEGWPLEEKELQVSEEKRWQCKAAFAERRAAARWLFLLLFLYSGYWMLTGNGSRLEDTYELIENTFIAYIFYLFGRHK